MDENRKLWGLLRRRQCLVPTLRGWLAMVLVVATVVIVGARGLGHFLAPTEPLPGGVLVVEGWARNHVLAAARDEFHRGHYDRLYVIGGPVEVAGPLSEYKTYGELGAAVLLKLGLSSNEVQSVPAPWVQQDRTYTAAASLAKWLREQGLAPTKVHLLSEGPHARRSRLMCQQAMGPGCRVGVTAIPCRDYDLAHWWRSSGGFRTVLDEAFAYAYARFLFRAPKDQPADAPAL